MTATGLSTRPFAEAELRAPSRMAPRLVCTPPQRLSTSQEFVAWVASNKAELFQTMHTEGALLLRGFPMDGPATFEQLLLALELDLEVSYRGGLSPRSKITDRTWTSTDVAPPLVIGYHTEMCYLPGRPRYIGFYCDVAPLECGETVLFDAAAAWANLSDAVRQTLSRLGVTYRRHFHGQTEAAKGNNIHKTWMSAFGFQNREDLERFLAAEGTRFSWHADGSLTTEVSLPAVVPHAPSGLPCLSVTMNDQYSLLQNFEKVAHRLDPGVASQTRQLLVRQLNDTAVFMQTLTGDGTPLTAELCDAISKAAWDASLLFGWQHGDVLLVDNIRMAHGRLNVTPPRRIVAALGNLYDVREARASAA